MPRIAAPISSRSRSKGGATIKVALLFILLITATTACKVIAPPAPYEDYAIARAAVKAAQEADSARFATNLWNKAEDNFRSGQKAFRDADYESAKKHFQLAQQFAEKAENMTRLKKFQTGENFP